MHSRPSLPNLDPLRFVLALLVILFHIPQLSHNQGLPAFDNFPLFHRGSEAVFAFFTLSGFLIIRLLYLEKEKTGAVAIGQFYTRRILRIFPLYYLILIFGFVFYHVLLPLLGIPFPIEYNLVEGILLCTFFLPNVFVSLYNPGGILSILWSLGVEEQFYLAVAPAMAWLHSSFFVPFLAAFTVVSLGLLSTFANPFYLHFYYFSFGGLLSVLAEQGRLQGLRGNRPFQVLVLGVTVCHFCTDLVTSLPLVTYHAVNTLLFGFLLFTLAYDPLFTIRNRWALHLGKISYGLYMYHAIVMNLMVFVFLKLTAQMVLPDALVIVAINVGVIGLTILVAHVSYRFYEGYFLRLKRRYRPLSAEG
ncbi:Peptidoglycan/LPS O-acetylase OafA/YrhL, contains acyltransferase and SGNH-hydrolase domains [Catalinimonas alkaloidigena]|uniref:Peptidoglycan/LPS O-acetylase OafA/YrhL, contains acyltransferase and SGNH-hydrolase domains n=2 Tax=Catalinimonas alkaloidigena TaxID=1075417 RepID=A0A1G9UFV5_9BACT|nr:Peptidoglycan/LPS O-acetylase OafA/YrhL, contains acyltransferase and SGNH-hydrolase domains [Catalinimonas alkaloidigena]